MHSGKFIGRDMAIHISAALADIMASDAILLNCRCFRRSLRLEVTRDITWQLLGYHRECGNIILIPMRVETFHNRDGARAFLAYLTYIFARGAMRCQCRSVSMKYTSEGVQNDPRTLSQMSLRKVQCYFTTGVLLKSHRWKGSTSEPISLR